MENIIDKLIEIRMKCINYITIKSIKIDYKLNRINRFDSFINIRANVGYLGEIIDYKTFIDNYIDKDLEELYKIIPPDFVDITGIDNKKFYENILRIRNQYNTYSENTFNTLLTISILLISILLSIVSILV